MSSLDVSVSLCWNPKLSLTAELNHKNFKWSKIEHIYTHIVIAKKWLFSDYWNHQDHHRGVCGHSSHGSVNISLLICMNWPKCHDVGCSRKQTLFAFCVALLLWLLYFMKWWHNLFTPHAGIIGTWTQCNNCKAGVANKEKKIEMF